MSPDNQPPSAAPADETAKPENAPSGKVEGIAADDKTIQKIVQALESGKPAVQEAATRSAEMPAVDGETKGITTDKKAAAGGGQEAGQNAKKAEEKPRIIQKTILPVTGKIISAETATTPSPDTPPWTLQQFFNGEIDLDVELSKRFPTIPIMSSISFRSLGTKTGRGVATLSTPDGGANVIFDADAATRVVQLSFTVGSMLTLRFAMDNLSDMDRSRWLELMRREQGGMAFLWGAERWEHDYLICISRKYFTNMYAFSPHNFEAAVRMTPDVTQKLLDWLEGFWNKPQDEDEPPQLLTW